MPSNFAVTPIDIWRNSRGLALHKRLRAQIVFLIAFALNVPITMMRF